MRPDSIFYKDKVYIKGLHGIPDFPEYMNTKSDDWYWLENSKKEDNQFLWWDMSQPDSNLWR